MPRSFTLLHTLGEGAFGSVHLAEVRDDGGFVKRLAVKWLHPHLDHDEEQSRRLRDEARLLALLDHEHIVSVHGLTRIEGRLAVLMDRIDGADLAKTTGQPVPPRAAVAIVEAVADALDAAWEAVAPGQDAPLRVVHRDIKPSNIMVTARGGVRVLDFGVARATFDARESDTRSQQFGTARFMAPERWLQGVADAPSDVFSLGVTLVELVGGHEVPRPRLARAAFDEDLNGALRRLDAWPDVEALARAMTAFEPAERPTAKQVVAACHEVVGALPGPTLREWASGWVPEHAPHLGLKPENATVVVEDVSEETLALTGPAPEPYLGPGSTETLAPPREGQPSPSRRRWIAVAMALPVAALVLWVGPWWAGPPPVGEVPAPLVAPPSTPVAAPETRLPVPPAPAPEPLAVPPEVPAEPTPRVRVPAPAPLRAPEPAPASRVPSGAVTFVLAPPALRVDAPWGEVTHRNAVEVPHGTHLLSVDGDGGRWRCTVIVDGSFPTWRVDDAARDCVQVH